MNFWRWEIRLTKMRRGQCRERGRRRGWILIPFSWSVSRFGVQREISIYYNRFWVFWFSIWLLLVSIFFILFALLFVLTARIGVCFEIRDKLELEFWDGEGSRDGDGNMEDHRDGHLNHVLVNSYKHKSCQYSNNINLKYLNGRKLTHQKM